MADPASQTLITELDIGSATVSALIVTPEGFPLAYEVLPGNTADKSTLQDFLKKIEDQYGKA